MDGLLTITPTSAPWLSECLKRFDTLHVRRDYPGMRAPSPVLRFANLVHACQRDLYDPKRPGLLPHEDDLDTILRLAALRGGYKDEVDRAYDTDRARKLCRVYLDQADVMESEATIGVEVAGTFPILVGGQPLYALSARLDRVLCLPGGKIAGIDYKIGSRLPPISGILINLAALKAAHPNATAYEFWIESLSDGGVERTIFKGEEFRGAIKTLTAQVRRYLTAESYPAEPGEGCLWCPLRPGCQGSEQAGIREEVLEF